MNESTVIQRLMPIASFVMSLAYCAYLRWRNKSHLAPSFGQALLSQWSANQQATTLILSSPNSAKGNEVPRSVNSSRTTGGWEAWLSAAGDWLAPLLVWFLVMAMGFAVVSFLLLGDR